MKFPTPEVREALKRPSLDPAPADFAEHAAGLTIWQAMKRWNAGNRKVLRWYRETGVKFVARYRPPVEKPKRPSVPGHSNWGRPAAAPLAVDHTLAGQAATFLRKIYPSVHGMWIYEPTSSLLRDLPNKGRGHYMVGASVMTTEEMMATARRAGWEG